MSQHEPGPFGRARVEGNDIVIPCSGVGQAAYCLRLARAAPELLTAVETLIANNGTGAMDWAINTARAAIAKAKEA